MEKLLIDYLDDLNDEMMKTFKWYLSLNEMNGSQPIPRSRLMQDVTRPDTVDLMVQAYGETGAAEVTVDILFRMKQNHLGGKLTEGLADRQNSQEPHEQNQNAPMGTSSMFYQASQLTVCKQVKEKQEAFDKVQRSCAEHIQSQSFTTEMKIKEEIEKLCTLLKREEAKRLAAVKEETQKKIRLTELVAELRRGVFSLYDTVKEMEDLGADNCSMQAFKTNLERTQKSLPDPKQVAQLDQTKHLKNLRLRVGEKMLSDIKRGVFDSSCREEPHHVISSVTESDDDLYDDPYEF